MSNDRIKSRLLQDFAAVRERTLALTEGLSAEDMMLQSMPDASPTKWHLAHTTWFFEAFVLQSLSPGYRPFDGSFTYLFNSYYNAIGQRHPRPLRGLLSRPDLAQVVAYRHHVDRHIRQALKTSDSSELASLIETGLHHEMQHQELILTDIKHALHLNPAALTESRPQPACHRPTCPGQLSLLPRSPVCHRRLARRLSLRL